MSFFFISSIISLYCDKYIPSITGYLTDDIKLLKYTLNYRVYPYLLSSDLCVFLILLYISSSSNANILPFSITTLPLIMLVSTS